MTRGRIAGQDGTRAHTRPKPEWRQCGQWKNWKLVGLVRDGDKPGPRRCRTYLQDANSGRTQHIKLIKARNKVTPADRRCSFRRNTSQTCGQANTDG